MPHFTVRDILDAIGAAGLIATAALSLYQQVAIQFLKAQAAIHDAQIANLAAPTVTVNVAPTVEAKLPVDN